MWQSIELSFPADHPTAAGHFPGNPIIPGAVLLDAVLDALAIDSQPPLLIRAAKFFHPVRPGDRLRLQWRPLDDGAVTFECRLADAIAASGIIQPGRPQS